MKKYKELIIKVPIEPASAETKYYSVCINEDWHSECFKDIGDVPLSCPECGSPAVVLTCGSTYSSIN